MTPAQRRAARARVVRRRRRLALALGCLAFLWLMATGPLEHLSVAAGRVETLQESRGELREAVAELEERRDALQNPEEIELLARREHNLVMPDEQAFVVAAVPVPDRPSGAEERQEPEGFIERVGDGIRRLLDR